jgi:alpha-beta hydrolase superfamily lysophospholipase
MKILIDQRKVENLPVLEFYNPNAQSRLPIVFILHGYTGRKEDHFLHGYSLASKGYYAVSIDLHLHGELGEAVFMPARVSPRFLEVIDQSVKNLVKLLAGYQAVALADANRIGLMGISLGGAIIYHYLPNRIPNVKAAVTMVAGPVPLAEITFKNIQAVYPEFGVTDELLSELQSTASHEPFLQHVIDFPLLVQYGQEDRLISIDGVRQLFHEVSENYAKPERLELIEYPHTGHETPPGMFAQAELWFDKYLKG